MKRVALLSVLTLVALSGSAAGGAASAGPVTGLTHTKRTSFSTNWSGYVAFDPTDTAFTDVKGSWVQPTANCSHGRSVSAFWIGLDGWNSSTVEQIGTEADCVGPFPVYFAWYEFFPAGPVALDQGTYPVAPDDIICAEVSQNGTTVSLTLKDDDDAGCPSPAWTYTNNSTSATGLDFSSAEWIAEAPTRNLTDFGSVTFTAASTSDGDVTDGAIDNTEWSHDDVTMVTVRGPHVIVRADPGGLSGGGTAFIDSWLHS